LCDAFSCLCRQKGAFFFRGSGFFFRLSHFGELVRLFTRLGVLLRLPGPCDGLATGGGDLLLAFALSLGGVDVSLLLCCLLFLFCFGGLQLPYLQALLGRTLELLRAFVGLVFVRLFLAPEKGEKAGASAAVLQAMEGETRLSFSSLSLFSFFAFSRASITRARASLVAAAVVLPWLPPP